MDGDGTPDLALLFRSNPLRYVWILSVGTGQVLWQATGPDVAEFGEAMLGDIDLDGDGKPDFVTMTSTSNVSDIYAYANTGALLYVLPALGQGLVVQSLAKMGDIDGDGGEDFVAGCNDISGRGTQWMISGMTGATIYQSFGLLPGDKTSSHIGNMGDIDGDGVNDYVAFPYWSAQRAIAVSYSGATGAVIRSWWDYGESVVVGEDFDQDGVNDVVTGADWAILPPNVYGSTRCTSGRDGTELWHVDNFLAPPGSGISNGSTGWMKYSASLGVQPGSPYPVMAWMDLNWFAANTYHGRIRAYDMARAGQGPVTGVAYTSSGTLPLIGARTTATGSRVTVAKTFPGALAALCMSFNALAQPLDLTPLGFAGCQLYVAPDAAWLRVLGTTGIDRGYAAVDLTHTLAPSALGTAVQAQWFVLDPATGGYASTQQHALRLQ